MKIHAGKYKGRNYFMPKDIRPTQSMVSKSLFDILGQDLEGIEFLDIFAGGGSVGLEALSRGAKFCSFVEKEGKCVDVLQENVNLLGIEGYEIINLDAFAGIKYLDRKKRSYDIVFIDPPYDRELSKKALKTLSAYDIVHANSIIVVQHDKHEVLPEREGNLERFRERKFGSTILSFYKLFEE